MFPQQIFHHKKQIIEVTFSDATLHKFSEMVGSVTLFDWISFIASLATVAAAYFSYLAILQNKKNQEDLVVQSLHTTFLDINRDFANRSKKTLSSHDYELLVNLFERVAQIIRYKHVPLAEFKSFKEMMLDKDVVQFTAHYREENGQAYYEDLIWLMEEFRKKYNT